jgi:hypothetical protein
MLLNYQTVMLRGKPDVIIRFMRLIAPILVDVDTANVIYCENQDTYSYRPSRLLKAISYLEADRIQ